MTRIASALIVLSLLLAAAAASAWRVEASRHAAVADELSALRASLDKSYRIVRAIDGDTVELETLGKVRILGVNCPETWRKTTAPDGKGGVRETWERRPDADPRGIAAAEWMRAQEGRRVRVQTDKQERDRYGRLLAHLYLLPDGPDVASHLLRSGWADVCAIPPNTDRLSAWKSDKKSQ